jgi:L-lysine exporter family protein LysE/ArgO
VSEIATEFATAATGFGFALSLIVAIGAQNAFVLRQGLMRKHVAPVIAICIGSDIMLMCVGIAGFGYIVESAPWLVTAMRIFGGAFLVVYGVQAALRAMKPSALAEGTAGGRKSFLPVLGSALAVTYLNPHVYLDTVVLLGSLANSYEAEKWIFGFGCMAATTIWFTALGYGSRYLAPLFAKPKAWQILDFVIACVMFAIAVNILAPLVTEL